MNIEEKDEDGSIILVVSGKMIGGAEDERLRQTVDEHLTAGHTEIVVDLAGLTFIDSAGLGEIVLCRTLISSKNGTLKLRNLPKRVYDRLSITRLESLFEIADES